MNCVELGFSEVRQRLTARADLCPQEVQFGLQLDGRNIRILLWQHAAIGGFKDGKQLQTFYKKVFAWKMSPAPGGLMMVAPEKGGIAGGVGTSQSGASSVALWP